MTAKAAPYLCAVHLRDFRMTAAGFEDHQRVVLALEGYVVSLTHAVCERGVREGMTIPQAVQTYGGDQRIEIDEPDLIQEAEALDQLAHDLRKVSVSSLILPPDVLVIESPPDEAPAIFLQRVRLRLEHLGWMAIPRHVRCAVAQDARVVLMLARFNREDVIVAPGREAEALAALPIGALDVEAAALAALPLHAGDVPPVLSRMERAGLRTLGALATTSPSAVLSAFGAVGAHLQALARGEMGGIQPPLRPVLASASQVVNDPSFTDPLDGLFITARLANDLRDPVEERRIQAGRVELEVDFTTDQIRAPIGEVVQGALVLAHDFQHALQHVRQRQHQLGLDERPVRALHVRLLPPYSPRDPETRHG